MGGSGKLSRGKQAFFYGVLFAFCAGLSEAFLRLVDREALLVRGDDAETVYAFYGGRSGVASSREYRVRVDIGPDGLRSCGDESSPGGVFVLGDSFAEGWGVECERTFAELLRREGGLAVANGGIHGGTPSYYILRARGYLPRLRPKTVVLQLFDNDLDDLDKFGRFLEFTPDGEVLGANPSPLLGFPAGSVTRFIRELSVYRMARRVRGLLSGSPQPIKYYREGREPAGEILSHDRALEEYGGLAPLEDLKTSYGGQFEFYKYRSYNELSGDSVWSSRFRRMELYLDQLHAEIGKLSPGARLLVVYIPAKEVFAPGGIHGRYDGVPSADLLRRENAFHHLIADFVRRHGLTLVDGLEVFHGDAESLYFPGDAHLNEKGHRRLYEALRGPVAGRD